MWNRFSDTITRDWPYLAVPAMVAVMFIVLASGDKTATVDSKHWMCTASDTIGLEAKCIRYERVPSFQERK